MPRISTSQLINAVQLKEQAAAPATPSSGFGKVYCKTDGLLYYLNDAGQETALGAGGVTALNGMVGAVALQAGSNITLTAQSGNVIAIAASGGGSNEFPGGVVMPAAWFSADDLDDVLADGGSVTRWPNKISNGWEALVQVAGKTAPTFKTSIINGHDVVRFNGTTDTIGSANNRLQSSAAQVDLTVIFVAAVDSATNLVCVCGKAATGNYEYGLMMPKTGQSGSLWQSGGATYATPPAVASDPTAGTFYMGTHRMRTGAQLAVWRNGGAAATTTSFTGSQTIGSAQFTVGQRGDDSATWFFDGDLAELLVYNRALTLAELDAIGTYIADKYGLTISAHT